VCSCGQQLAVLLCNCFWFQVLSEEIVVRLLSRSWVVREDGLRMLSRAAVTALLSDVGGSQSDIQVSVEFQENTQLMLECCFSVLTHMLADPVYNVFVAGLVCLVLSLVLVGLNGCVGWISA